MTCYSLFEYLVMPFSLCNAPATFQAYVNKALQPYLNVFCTAYIDDILIYSNTLKEHWEHVNLVLNALTAAGLHLDINKCQFETQEVIYLGLFINTISICMNSSKVDAILTWESPQSIKDVQGFLRFANFYQRFIRNFSRLVKPLVNLTQKDVKFS